MDIIDLKKHLEYDIKGSFKQNKATLYLWPLTRVNLLTYKIKEKVNYKVYLCLTEDGELDFKHLMLVLDKDYVPYSTLKETYPNEKIMEYDKHFVVKVAINDDYPDYYEFIIRPFLEGKYSWIDDDYKKNHFLDPTVKFTGNSYEMIRSFSHGVLNKEDSLREAWGDFLNTYIPRELELDSAPDLDKEVYIGRT